MKRFGLIGFPLKNKFSVNYFTQKFNALNLLDHVYENFPIEHIEELISLLEKNPDLAGLTVTIPHKISVIKYLDELDESAKEVGAVNCVRISCGAQPIENKYRNYKLTGFNTDVFGFEQSLTRFIDQKGASLKALVLGTGGAAKAVAFVLTKLGIEFAFVTRNMALETSGSKHFTYHSLNETIFREYHLIINCTPAGMFPNENEAPALPYQFVTSNHFAFDMIYHPEETLFLKYFREHGAKTKNGLEMLHLQAEKAWEIFSRQ